MFSEIATWFSDKLGGPSHASDDRFAIVEAAYGRWMDQRDADFRSQRSEILLAGGGRLDARPSIAEAYGAAIRRLHHEGALRERIEYGPFPTKRIYHYVLTPTGEREADRLRGAPPTAPAA